MGEFVMNNSNTAPCEHCQKAFHQHTELSCLYCGHHRVIAFRIPGHPVVLLPVSSTAEAMQVIEHANHGTAFAVSA
jgi:DNA-directed RNA polymerase subunit RPC12/RpoP